ncbi:MAG: MJ1477/TM1410 family putative glycoside hydrolase [FCB group bacterium]|jgi:cysteinyl-tRNA synthetase
MKKLIFIIIIFIITNNLFCQTDSLTNIKRWAYQLQNININEIASGTSFQLVVIDYSADGTDIKKISSSQIAQIKNSGKKVLAYISIGETENYRYYWQSSWDNNPPVWLGDEDILNPGNYIVQYWSPQWQTIIYGYIDKIIQQGFDGIYMKGIENYYYWMYYDIQNVPADSLMIQFIINIRNHVKSKNKNLEFYLVPQNGEDIINSENVSFDLVDTYLQTINGVGVEDIFFGGNLENDNNFKYDSYDVLQLTEYKLYDVPVFSIEYLTDPAKITKYLHLADSLNYTPYYCTRALNQLCTNEPTHVSEKFPEQSQEILAYPNPAKSELILSSNKVFPECLKIEIFNTEGMKIESFDYNNMYKQNSIRINIENLSNGTYIVKKQGDGFDRICKFIIER